MNLQYNRGINLKLQQLKGMFTKKILHTKRNWIFTLIQILVPVVFLVIGCIILKHVPEQKDSDPLTLNLDTYAENDVPYSTNKLASSFIINASNAYSNFFTGTTGHPIYVNKISGTKTVYDYLSEKAEENIYQYRKKYVLAGAFNNNSSVIGLFNGQLYHSIAISINAISNAMLQLFSGQDYKISTINHPLPMTQLDKVVDTLVNSGGGFSFATMVIFGMAFASATFSIFIIKERVSNSRQLQAMTGASDLMYWGSAFIWDYILLLVPSIGLIICFAAFDVEQYYGGNRLGEITLLFVSFGFACLPYTYLFSRLFVIPSNGLSGISTVSVIFGITAVIAAGILKIPGLNLKKYGDIIEWIFLSILPHYIIGSGLLTYYNNHNNLKSCKKPKIQALCPYYEHPCCKDNCGKFCVPWQENYLSMEDGGIGRQILFSFIQFIIYFGLVLFLDSSLFHRILKYIKSHLEQGYAKKMQKKAENVSSLSSKSNVPIDDDVDKERIRLNQISIVLSEGQNLDDKDTIMVNELSKYYPNKKAVDKISVGIRRGECFGLLGVNGAGKTTTFKMLTGDETFSEGSAVINGVDVGNNIKKVQEGLGYCPQFDALIDQMTTSEYLVMFARLRGVKEDHIPCAVDALIDSLTLRPHANKMTSKLSGGNKRKLSTAVSLIGNPPIIFLDEPTNGVDPCARRSIWNTLSEYRAAGHTLLYTSHSMEECEALCTRLAIMVNGEFKCLGGTQHLKSKFDDGYTLVARVGVNKNSGVADPSALIDFIEKTFPESRRKDVHQGLVHYQIPHSDLKWAQIFGAMERARKEYNIEDYSVSQTTLEQVFINFARAQNDDTELKEEENLKKEKRKKLTKKKSVDVAPSATEGTYVQTSINI